MTLAGWIFLVISWGVILSIVVFCFVKMFKVGRK